MKKILVLLLGLSLTGLRLSATTPVTGSLKDLSTGVVQKNAKVRLWLRGCGGNQPRVLGTALIGPTLGTSYYKEFLPDVNGLISGTVYSTRDAAGTGNGDVDCGGSKTAAWYGVQIFVNGVGGTEVPVHAKSGVTLDLTSVVPLSVTPVATAPTGDATYLRLDAGNSPVTGATAFNSNVTVGGTFGVTGATTLSKLNNTIYADQQAGADACAKIVTSCGLLASTGGTVDATGFQGNQTCAAGISCAANKPIKIKLGAAPLITGSSTALTCPAGGLLSVVGLGPTGSGSGATSVLSSTASTAAVQWNCSEGTLENLLIFNTVGDGLALTASGTNSVQHNHFQHLHISSAGVINAGKAGLHKTAASATALVTENTFDDINIDDFDISELNDSSAAQGPTDNHHHGFTYTGFAGGSAGIKVVLGDTTDWSGGFVSGRTTGYLGIGGTQNVVALTRMESNTTDVNDAGTKNMFVADTFFNCATSVFAATDYVLANGNTTCAVNQIPGGVTVTPKVQTFTSNGTFTIPAGIRAVKVTVIGAGGAGGGSSTTNWGSGGGSGGTGIKYLSGLTPGNTIAVAVGVGGTGVANATGNAGTDSSISSGTQTITTVTAKGGSGGLNAGGAQPGGNGGAIGTNGDINVGGQQGGNSTANTFGGVGAPSSMGGGGGAVGNAAGNPGLAPGAGGAGASEVGAGTAAGGAGLAGIVIFEWSN